MKTLADLGFTDFFEAQRKEIDSANLVPARVVFEHRGGYRVQNEDGVFEARLRGKLRHRAALRADLPTVGDWVLVEIQELDETATIEHRLIRQSQLVRSAAGRETDAQTLAANIDTVFVVTSLDGEFNIRRLERYLTAVWEGGSNPVILLNKADMCPSVEDYLQSLSGLAAGLSVHVVSALERSGLDHLDPYLLPGKTVAFVGSSGVGKSTLINALLDCEELAVGAISPRDGRGRHTTTSRQLLRNPRGGMVIDTPGLREFGLWSGEVGLTETFGDIEKLAQGCAFRNCSHDQEPGCAVRAALDRGELEEPRLDGYRKLMRELAYQQRRQDEATARSEQLRWKRIAQQYRALQAFKRRNRED